MMKYCEEKAVLPRKVMETLVAFKAKVVKMLDNIVEARVLPWLCVRRMAKRI